MRAPGARQSYLLTPVNIQRNVWLGMNAVLIGHTIGADTFVKPGSVISEDIATNSLVAGAPAKRVDDRFKINCQCNGDFK